MQLILATSIFKAKHFISATKPARLPVKITVTTCILMTFSSRQLNFRKLTSKAKINLINTFLIDFAFWPKNADPKARPAGKHLNLKKS
jgi:hypothetical protein